MRRFARIDDNQKEIVQALRDRGATVQSLASVGGGCPDIVVGWDGRNVLIEIKDGSKPASARKLTPAEQTFHMEWRGEVYIVEHVSEAITVVFRTGAKA